MAYTLRNFKNDDGQGVKDLILTILAKEYPFDKKAYADSDLDKIGEVYGGRKDSFFVIEEDGKIVGTVGVKGETADEALLRRLFIEQGHRKKGYGSQLLKTAVRFCRDNGYRKMYFRCTDRMVDAMRLCEKEGFKKKESLEVSGFNIHKLELSI
jgi:putative acetyltransferase